MYERQNDKELIKYICNRIVEDVNMGLWSLAELDTEILLKKIKEKRK